MYVGRLSASALFAIVISCGIQALETPLLALTPSPEGTQVPTATVIVDSSLASWTLASDRRVLKDGVQAADGYATKIYWYGASIYVAGLDGYWYRWSGSSWIREGTSAPTLAPTVSPDQATVPTTTNMIVDSSLATWTLTSDARVLRNGVHAAGGLGTIIYWFQQTIYLYGIDAKWWMWTGSDWSPYGPTKPGVVTPAPAPPPPSDADNTVLPSESLATDGTSAQTPAPTVSPDQATVPTTTNMIVDSSLATWTLASDTRVLRNGAHAAGGLGTVIYWFQRTIYVYGTDAKWWTWTGAGWSPYGPTKPGEPAILTPEPPPPPPPTTDTGYVIAPGQSIQNVVSLAPEGATVLLKAGVHRIDRAIVPKANQVIVGEAGAIVSGAHRLTDFWRSGNYWVASGQIQQGAVQGSIDNSMCARSAPRCGFPEDLFIDNVLLTHAASLAAVGPGSWYFDYEADAIYLVDDPTGHVVETSVTPFAFEGSASSVTIRGLIVEKFATPTQKAALNGQGRRWVFDSNEVRFNHAIGIRTNDAAIARNNRVHHNGAMGLAGSGADILVENNEIAFNNTVGYNPYWEAGGTKWVYTSRLTVRGNYAHDNHGPGLWTDINNINVLFENNRVEDNDLSGIFHEIGYAAVIRNNSVSRNGRLRPSPGWIDGAGILVAGSSDVEIYGNTLVDNFQGICGLEGHRGSGLYGEWVLQNLNVHHNQVTQTGTVTAGSGRSGIIDTAGTAAFFSNNWFAQNTYLLGANRNYFIWMNSDINEVAWNNYSQDTTGTFIRQ